MGTVRVGGGQFRFLARNVIGFLVQKFEFRNHRGDGNRARHKRLLQLFDALGRRTEPMAAVFAPLLATRSPAPRKIARSGRKGLFNFIPSRWISPRRTPVHVSKATICCRNSPDPVGRGHPWPADFRSGRHYPVDGLATVVFTPEPALVDTLAARSTGAVTTRQGPRPATARRDADMQAVRR